MDQELADDRHISKRTLMIISVSLCLCAFSLIYLGISVYFMNHFYFGSTINGTSAAGKTAEAMSRQVSAGLKSYALTLDEKGGETERITGAEIGLKISSDGEIDRILKEQESFRWVSSLFSANAGKHTVEVSYDGELLKQRVSSLTCVTRKDASLPGLPSFKYDGGGYTVSNGESGNKVDIDKLLQSVKSGIAKGKTSLNLEDSGCYEKPRYTSDSPKAIEAKELLDRYVSARITYSFGNSDEVIDGSVISEWLGVDDSMNVVFKRDDAKKYINALSEKYSKLAIGKDFITTSGKAIRINGLNYSWKLNASQEADYLLSAVKAGKKASKKFPYIEDGYVEIDLTGQHLWFYKKGKLAAQGNIVSGNISSGHTTPEGIYRLLYKKRGAILTGPGYKTRVEYWMPFYNGMGIHDATWRKSFGGSIYRTDGSHGCINCPYSLAKTIYENIEADTPIICYYR